MGNDDGRALAPQLETSSLLTNALSNCGTVWRQHGGWQPARANRGAALAVGTMLAELMSNRKKHTCGAAECKEQD